jgi:hypothetical protein
VESHLLPKALYKLARDVSRANPNPVTIARGRALISSEQIREPFLCRDCDNRFSRFGERYVIGHCRRGYKFALREALESARPVIEETRFKVYEVSGLLRGNEQQFLYFAASVFWRAAAREWRGIERISLGARYQEQFRQYLLDKAAFPADARLFVHVSRTDALGATSTVPCSSRARGYRRHSFCIPGIAFILFVGREAAKSNDQYPLNATNGHFMWLVDGEDGALFRGITAMMREAIPANPRRGISHGRARNE